MSELDNAKKLLDGVQSDTIELRKSVTALESASNPGEIAAMKEQIDKIEKSSVDKDEAIEKLVKSIEADKAKTKMMGEIDSDSQKRKEIAEFRKGLMDIAEKRTEAFKTNEFKSVLDLKNYNSGDDSVGGITVISFIDSMIDKLIREFSDVRMLATTSTISTDKWEQIKMNQTNGALWEKDVSNFTDQTKNNTFDKLNIMIENLYGIAIMHKNLIADSAFDVVGEILTSLAEDFAITEAASFWNGSGKGEMSGILTAPAVGSGKGGFDEIERITSAASQVVTMDDIHTVIGSIKQPGYLQGAQWKANRVVISQLRKLKDLEGQYLWQPSNIVGIPATLVGYPISAAPELAANMNVANVESIVFGNFSKAYRIIDRQGIEIVRDNLTQYPQIAYKADKRVGGGVQKGEALKILKTQA